MSAAPLTVLDVAPGEAEAIRAAVRTAVRPGQVLAGPEHAGTLAEMLADPRVSDPIYSLVRPITRESVAAWIAEARAQRERGEGLLFLTLDEAGRAAGYADVAVWPERSAAELGGAIRADRQNSGQGKFALGTFNWIFEALGVRMMCLTAALDNVRSIRMIDGAGFTRMGERDCVRPDGSVRPSVYWEMTRQAWRERWGSHPLGRLDP